MAAPTPAGTDSWKLPKKASLWIILAAFSASLGGYLIVENWLQPSKFDDPWPLIEGSEMSDGCALPENDPASELNTEVAITQFPEVVEINLGTGRGRRIIASDRVAVTPLTTPDTTVAEAEQAGAEETETPEGGETTTAEGTEAAGDGLPGVIPLQVLPLTSGEGNQLPEASSYLARLGDTETYQLVVCIDAASASPGSYQAAIAITDSDLNAEYTPSLTVNLQHEGVNMLLWAGVPVMLLGGLWYTSVLLLRRANPAFSPFDATHLQYVNAAFLSTNGVLAVTAGTLAAWQVWRVTAYTNPSWGADYVGIAATAGAMVAAISGAAAMPFGLASKTLDIPEPDSDAEETPPDPGGGAAPLAPAEG